jgi:hypothetical protein
MEPEIKENSMPKKRSGRLGAAGLAALLAIGCSPEATGGGLVLVHVSFAQAGAAPNPAPVLQLDPSGVIELASVEKLDAQLDAVELHTSGSGWQRVDLASAVQLDLLALPGSGSALPLGDVTVEAGACQARLFVSHVVIRFNQDITVGRATFNQGVDYTTELRIPSGNQTGLKADGVCDVQAGPPANVTLAFDAGATVGTIVVTGSGSILLTPVIHIAKEP